MSTPFRVPRSRAYFVGLFAMALALPAIAVASGTALDPATPGVAQPGPSQRDTLLRYTRNTWASFDAMTDPQSGLPGDVRPALEPVISIEKSDTGPRSRAAPVDRR